MRSDFFLFSGESQCVAGAAFNRYLMQDSCRSTHRDPKNAKSPGACVIRETILSGMGRAGFASNAMRKISALVRWTLCRGMR
jgi:hypothetical protein